MPHLDQAITHLNAADPRELSRLDRAGVVALRATLLRWLQVLDGGMPPRIVEVRRLLDTCTAADLHTMERADRILLANRLREWAWVAEHSTHRPKTGVIAELNHGDRAQ